MTALANRLGTTVQAHTETIVYTGVIPGQVEADYDAINDPRAKNPEPRHEWPTRKVGDEARREHSPPRFAPSP